MAQDTNKKQAGPRGLSREVMVQAAIDLMEAGGEAAFSLRKLGSRLGCDPMAVLYHFKSKDGLYRAMADALTAHLHAVDEVMPWDQRLMNLAGQYRRLAQQYPHTFLLMQRFLNTGGADFGHIEMVHRALGDAGLPAKELASACLGWYAAVIGLAAAQVQGLIRSATPDELEEIQKLPPEEYPLLTRAVPALRKIDAAKVQDMMLDLLHEGIKQRAGQNRRATTWPYN